MNFKKLMEKRADLQLKMKNLLNQAETEERAITEEEKQEFDGYEAEIRAIDTTIAAGNAARSLEEPPKAEKKKEEDEEETEEERAAAEENIFADYLRGTMTETRADVNMAAGDNGAVIPVSIANKIIKKVQEICPIYSLADRYPVKGNLQIPYYDETSGSITTAYTSEFSDLESTSGKFKNIELKGFLAGALTKVSKSLMNNSQFDIVSFVINAMAESMAKFIENELLNGTKDKVDGLSKTKQKVTAAASTAITADELIDLQEQIPDRYQPGCIWIMNKATRTAIRKLKDSDGDYILNKDMTSKWGYTLFGNDVYVSDNMPAMEAGKTAIYYGDMSGLAVKVSEEMEIEVLREKYATQHVVGVVGFIELDGKIEDEQKIAALIMKAAS